MRNIFKHSLIAMVLSASGLISSNVMAYAITVDAERSLIFHSGSGLPIKNIVRDASNPASPTVIATFDSPASANKMHYEKASSLLYVAMGSGGLQIMDTSDPANPVVVGTYSGVVSDIAIKDNIGYVAGSRENIDILDLSDISNIQLIDSLDYFGFSGEGGGTPWSATVAIYNNTLLVGGQPNHVNVHEIQAPGQLSLIGIGSDFGTSRHTHTILIKDDVAILDNGHLIVADAATGGTLDLEFNVPGSPAFVDSNLFMVGAAAIKLFDISNPTSIYEVTSVDREGSEYGPNAIASLGNYIYTYEYQYPSYVFKVIDASDAQNPVQVNALAANDNTQAPPPNFAPIADAGSFISARPRQKVTLDGTNSYDPDGTIVKYQWTQSSYGPRVELTGADTPMPSFTTPRLKGKKNNYVRLLFTLRVTDNGGREAVDSVAVSILK